MPETRRAKLKRIQTEIVRLAAEADELSEMGPEPLEELEGFHNLLELARESAKDAQTEIVLTITTPVRLKCHGGLFVPLKFDIDKYDVLEDTDIELGIFDKDGELKDVEKVLGQCPEVNQFRASAKLPYAQYATAFDAFCELHLLESEEERDALRELLEETLGVDPAQIEKSEDYDEEDDDIPF